MVRQPWISFKTWLADVCRGVISCYEVAMCKCTPEYRLCVRFIEKQDTKWIGIRRRMMRSAPTPPMSWSATGTHRPAPAPSGPPEKRASWAHGPRGYWDEWGSPTTVRRSMILVDLGERSPARTTPSHEIANGWEGDDLAGTWSCKRPEQGAS
jgi:hypothetical protein